MQTVAAGSCICWPWTVCFQKYADSVLEALIKEGWTWKVISAEVEEP